MVNGKIEVLAVIPARGGSKGIPRKNIKNFAGHPLIAYSIQAALNSKYVTRTIVSTDDDEIAEVAKKYGAEVPFLRPSEFAQDSSLDFPVFENLLQTLMNTEDYKPDFVIQLRPTSPIRPDNLVDDAIEIMLNDLEIDSVRGVVPSGQNPFKMWKIDPVSGIMQGLLQVEGIHEPYNSARQALPDTFWQTGHIDVIRTNVIIEKKSMSGEKIKPIHIHPDFTVDLDKPSDWQKAEWLVWHAGLEMVVPGNKRRPLPEKVDLIVFDFDGVMTDDRVFVDQHGIEMVAANRRDGMGINLLHKAGFKMIVLSSEKNPVVEARCKKLKIQAIQGVEEKSIVLEKYLSENHITPKNVIYIGNDVNDLTCFPEVGCALAVADAHPTVLRHADIVLQHNGGQGAVREVCDLLLRNESQ
ncbi:MAG TPA: acylneuraminate cytidylyltransferase [Anaerolineaceae bacterium]|nr:acylneuraminate cytidylyltransferase [Anaerolineaceae bacterium]